LQGAQLTSLVGENQVALPGLEPLRLESVETAEDDEDRRIVSYRITVSTAQVRQ
jgi:hypothetical protein